MNTTPNLANQRGLLNLLKDVLGIQNEIAEEFIRYPKKKKEKEKKKRVKRESKSKWGSPVLHPLSLFLGTVLGFQLTSLLMNGKND